MKKNPVKDQSLVGALIDIRLQQHVSQQALAARMHTSQPSLVLIERGQRDPRLSTVLRYAESLGKRITWTIEDA